MIIDELDRLKFATQVDELDSDQSQSELNADVIDEVNKNVLIHSFDGRISKFYFDYIKDSIDMDESEYFRNLGQALIKEYSIMSFRNILDGIFNIENLNQDILDAYYYIRIKLIENIVFDESVNNIKFDENIEREEFENYLKFDKAPVSLVESFRFIDNDNFKIFKKKILIESKKPYIE
jgi:hypothetical protein